MPSAKPNLHQRRLAVMQAVSYVQKEKKQGMKYSIVSHDAVTALLRAPMMENGILCHPTDMTVRQNGNRTEVKLTVRFLNAEAPEDYADVPSLGFGIDDQDKGPGKAISYAVKYALLKFFQLETGDDPDTDQTVRHQPDRAAIPRADTPPPAAPAGERTTTVPADDGWG